MVYAYGQRVHATIKFRFTVSSPKVLQLTWEESPPHLGFDGYTPKSGTSTRNIPFSLEQGEFTGVEANAGPSTYHWKLTLDSSPFPDELKFPPVLRLELRPGYSEGPPVRELNLPEPLIYFGHMIPRKPPKPVSLWREIRGLFELLKLKKARSRGVRLKTK
jgi:hypothetical protein